MRNLALWIMAFVTLLTAVVTAKMIGPVTGVIALVGTAFAGIALYDVAQTRHSILRNFPLIGHARYLLESIRPEINQYFIESNANGAPFNRAQRSLVYQRAKRVTDTVPFGMQMSAYEAGHEWVSHSLAPTTLDDAQMRTVIGGPRCRQPYSMSRFVVSAMSYGALSQNAVEALNSGAKIGGFAHNTGEGGVSDHHLRHGGDLIWQIGTGYFGCRTPDGKFSPEKFAEMARRPNIKMIEIKLSQGAKPGLGGLLPAAKVTPEISRIRGVNMGEDVHSPPAHTQFSNPRELVAFVARLQELSGGKPVGIKLCLGSLTEFVAICKAMRATGRGPDFVTVDGSEGGTGAAPLEFTNNVGMPLEDALVHVRNCLVGFGLRRQVSILCSGRVVTGFDLVKRLALGADACASARAMMMAIGCIQALQCNTNKCPTGVATQDPWLMRGLVVPDKATRVANYHKETIKAARSILEAMGITRVDALEPHHVNRRTSTGQAKRLDELHMFVEPGSFVKGPIPEPYATAIAEASPDSFQPVRPTRTPGANVTFETARNEEDQILVTEQDYERLLALLRSARPDEVDERLVAELARAAVVPPREIPPNVVTMNSELVFVDEESGNERKVQLVYPAHANAESGKLSVFAPMGAALLGLSVGQTIEWPLPQGRTKTVRVKAVAYQPEAAGHWDL